MLCFVFVLYAYDQADVLSSDMAVFKIINVNCGGGDKRDHHLSHLCGWRIMLCADCWTWSSASTTNILRVISQQLYYVCIIVKC